MRFLILKISHHLTVVSRSLGLRLFCLHSRRCSVIHVERVKDKTPLGENGGNRWAALMLIVELCLGLTFKQRQEDESINIS